jgi:hypothetical protein
MQSFIGGGYTIENQSPYLMIFDYRWVFNNSIESKKYFDKTYLKYSESENSNPQLDVIKKFVYIGDNCKFYGVSPTVRGDTLYIFNWLFTVGPVFVKLTVSLDPKLSPSKYDSKIGIVTLLAKNIELKINNVINLMKDCCFYCKKKFDKLFTCTQCENVK